jgi:hypothetical protein
MNIKRKLFASQYGMILLDNGKPKEIGGITEPMELELKNDGVIKVHCVFFNLDSKVESTDFFLFEENSERMITFYIGDKTDTFFCELYAKAFLHSSVMNTFIDHFVSNYITEGLEGNLPLK